MESHHLYDQITELTAKFKRDLGELLAGGPAAYAPAEQIIDCDLFKRRAKYIDSLKDARASMQECISIINTAGEASSKVHAVETAKLSELVGATTHRPLLQYKPGPAQPSWQCQKKQPIQLVSASIPREVSELTYIPVTASAGIHAKVVETASAVHADGVIYYIRTAEHFAVRCGPMFLHGNVGVIYDVATEPQKIKYCRYGRDCLRPDVCTYYHDPLEVPGSKDCKNFTSVSFVYSSSRNGYRRIGSRERFDIDLAQIQQNEPELKQFFDQVAHEFFCAVLIAEMQKI